MKKKGIFLVVIACFFWGTMGITSRNLDIVGLDSFTIAFFRAAIAGIVYLLFVLKRDKSLLKTNRKDLIFFFIYGIVALGFSFIGYSLAVSRIPIAVATVLLFTNPIWVIIINRICFKEKIKIKELVAIVVTIFGCMLIVKLFDLKATQLDMVGILVGMFAGAAFALQIVLPKFHNTGYKKDTLLVYGFMSATIFLSFFVDFKGLITSVTNYNNLGFVISNILAIALLSTFISNVAYVKATDYIDTSLISILVSLEIIVASIFAYFIFNETLESSQLVGMGIVIFAVIMLQVDIKFSEFFKKSQKVHIKKLN
ncbi:DMT family transporter [Clostridium sediminicola]|uniref:DMT family transporter n=1 Tax=Clostridium sediminicola TaxID=3114879 RepID=UPI0031F2209E